MHSLNSIMHIGLEHYLVLSATLFIIGALGVLLRKNLLVILMCIELMLNAVNLSFIAFSHFSNHVDGQIMVFFVMAIAAAEAGVGLAIAVNIFKKFKEIDIDYFEELRG